MNEFCSLIISVVFQNKELWKTHIKQIIYFYSSKIDVANSFINKDRRAILR